MQFEAKTYKNQSKGFAEVTGNFHNKDSILSWLIPKKKHPKAKYFFQNSFQANFPCIYPLKTSKKLNLWFSDIFRWFRSGTLTWNWHVNHHRISQWQMFWLIFMTQLFVWGKHHIYVVIFLFSFNIFPNRWFLENNFSTWTIVSLPVYSSTSPIK